MTLTDLEKLEALHAAATSGEWSPEVWQGNDDTDGWAATGPHQHTEDCICETEEEREACKGMGCCEEERSYRDEEQAQEDAKAIAALHNAFPAMAKALREARAHNEKLIERLKETDVRAGEWLGILEKMERERDEALAEVERLKAELADSEERRLGWAKEVGRLAAQRADLRAEVKRLRSLLALKGWMEEKP
jgi:hypothetical protein